MNSVPRLSVVIPAFNAAAYLPETLRSLCDQMASLEIIIIDDGSTDNTAEVVGPLLSDRVRYQKEENSGGPAAPRNRGIQMARAPLIGFFDADDVALPGTLEASVDLMEANPGVGMLCTNFHLGDESLNVTTARVVDEKAGLNQAEKERLNESAWRIPSSEALAALLRNNFVGTPSVIIRREVFDRVGGYDENLKNLDDRDMWLRVARHYDLIYRDEPTFIYRSVSTSISKQGLERQALERVQVGKKLISGGLPSRTRKLARQWIARNQLVLGYSHFELKARSAALRAFLRSFFYSPSWPAMKGVIKSMLPHGVYRSFRSLRH